MQRPAQVLSRNGDDGASLDVAGDGWNVWAEPVGTDGNDPTTLHVRVRLPRATSDDQVAATVTHLYGSGLLTVAADGWQTVAAASCWEDWSEEAGGLVWVREGKALGMRRYEEPTDN